MDVPERWLIYSSLSWGPELVPWKLNPWCPRKLKLINLPYGSRSFVLVGAECSDLIFQQFLVSNFLGMITFPGDTETFQLNRIKMTMANFKVKWNVRIKIQHWNSFKFLTIRFRILFEMILRNFSFKFWSKVFMTTSKCHKGSVFTLIKHSNLQNLATTNRYKAWIMCP